MSDTRIFGVTMPRTWIEEVMDQEKPVSPLEESQRLVKAIRSGTGSDRRQARLQVEKWIHACNELARMHNGVNAEVRKLRERVAELERDAKVHESSAGLLKRLRSGDLTVVLTMSDNDGAPIGTSIRVESAHYEDTGRIELHGHAVVDGELSEALHFVQVLVAPDAVEYRHVGSAS